MVQTRFSNHGSEGVAEYFQDQYGTTPGGGGDNIDFEDNNFVPAGMLTDLEDPIDPFDVITNVVGQTTTDIIEGFTPEMFFNALDEDVESIDDFRIRLGELHLDDTPNTEADFNNFINVYDVL